MILKTFKQEFDLILNLNFYYIENAFQICVSAIIARFFTKNFLHALKIYAQCHMCTENFNQECVYANLKLLVLAK